MKYLSTAILFLALPALAQFTDDFNRPDENLDASANWMEPPL
jgi:hypothetical protein